MNLLNPYPLQTHHLVIHLISSIELSPSSTSHFSPDFTFKFLLDCESPSLLLRSVHLSFYFHPSLKLRRWLDLLLVPVQGNGGYGVTGVGFLPPLVLSIKYGNNMFESSYFRYFVNFRPFTILKLITSDRKTKSHSCPRTPLFIYLRLKWGFTRKSFIKLYNQVY